MARPDIISETRQFYKAGTNRKDDPSSWNPIPKYTVAPSKQKKPATDI